jgi:hypothetical protein
MKLPQSSSFSNKLERSYRAKAGLSSDRLSGSGIARRSIGA